MIRNIVFDYGNVMIRFEPSYMVGRYVNDPDDARLLEKVVFDRLYWDRLDDGSISDSEVVEAVKGRIPERLWAVSEEIYYNWVNNLPEIDGMSDLVSYVKDELGVRVFLLSNISTYFADHASEREELEPFERCIFSAVVGHTKPHADMFEYLCRECKIKPEETLFVDDSAKNIAGAEAFGIKGYLFDGDSARLRKFIDSLLGK
ncbi:MAG: HAD family phosphatase [Ruminococcaceae bacterium]|nr:HAD family phosphatase [Oscillospiraceae bacterium]